MSCKSRSGKRGKRRQKKNKKPPKTAAAVASNPGRGPESPNSPKSPRFGSGNGGGAAEEGGAWILGRIPAVLEVAAVGARRAAGGVPGPRFHPKPPQNQPPPPKSARRDVKKSRIRSKITQNPQTRRFYPKPGLTGGALSRRCSHGAPAAVKRSGRPDPAAFLGEKRPKMGLLGAGSRLLRTAQ